jgi:His-Xaa-Ser system radical SAM maturase HxsB
MTAEVAERGLDFVFRSPSRAIKIEFQGGEPLLNFELIRHIVLEAKRRNESHGRDLRFVIATTLSLLTDEMLEFCVEHQIDLSASLDGPEDLHNANRPRPSRDSHQRFVEGLLKARAALGYQRISALMTTTERSLQQPEAIVDEYLRLGFNTIFLRPLSPYGFALKTKSYAAYEVERWLDFYRKGLGYIIDLNRRGVEFSEQYAAIILKKMFTSSDPGYVDLMNPAGAGIAAIVFNYDGGVYASDESRMLAEMGDHKFRVGHLLEDSYEEIILSDNLLDALEDSFTLSVPMCSDCAFEPFCGADPVFHHATQGDVVGRKPDSAFCQRNMAIFKHLIRLMRSDPFASDLFRRWATQC